MARIEIRDAHLGHVRHVAMNLREADREEITAAWLIDPEDMIVETYWKSDVVCAGIVDGEPVCLFGVVRTTFLGVAAPWMVATDKLEQHQKAFLRRNRKVVGEWLDMYGRLENYVSARNFKSIMWLDWLGFNLDEPKPAGVLRRPFIRFWKERSDVYDGSSDSGVADRDGDFRNGSDAGGIGPGRLRAV